MKGILAFGFDGVLCLGSVFDPVNPSACEGPPVPGMKELFAALFCEGWEIEICTPRALVKEGRDAVIHWLNANGFLEFVACVTASRHIANVYVDRDLLPFTGAEGLTERIRNFPNWSNGEDKNDRRKSS